MKISIVTTVLNRADLIDEAIDSVHAQEGIGVEHVVVDGGSTDGTIERLAAYPHIRVISLPGSRPEEALNEGIRQSTGEIVGFLMSDDRLAPGILQRVAAVFHAQPKLDIVSTGAGFFAVDSQRREIVLSSLRRRPIIDFNYRTILLGPLLACARFYRRRVFERVGCFATTYRFCNDRDLLWRALIAGCANACIGEIGYWYRSHAGSRSVGGTNDIKRQIAEDHLRMAEDYLRSSDLRGIHRRWLRRFYATECARAMFRSLAVGQLRASLSIMLRGFHFSSLWPLIALREMAILVALRFAYRG